MKTAPIDFNPNYIIPPGEILEETLQARGLKKRDFAERCGKSSKTISQIIAGSAPISASTAIAFERVLGVRASLWNNLESRYRLQLAEQQERAHLASQTEWANQFPLANMKKFGLIKSSCGSEAVEQLLDFFGVGSVETWNRLFLHEHQTVAFRASRSFQSKPHAVATWLRWGEKHAESVVCPSYSEDRFRKALGEIRSLTRLSPASFQKPLRDLCSEAGVVVLWRPELDGTRLSGATKWVSKDKVLIQLSLRHKTDDHFWFSFFHEAAHVLLHGKKDVFIDDASNIASPEEAEADEFAQQRLIPRRDWLRLTKNPRYSKATVKAFADSIGIAPGIVVGQLQHKRLLPFSHLNGLKRGFVWTDALYRKP